MMQQPHMMQSYSMMQQQQQQPPMMQSYLYPQQQQNMMQSNQYPTVQQLPVMQQQSMMSHAPSGVQFIASGVPLSATMGEGSSIPPPAAAEGEMLLVPQVTIEGGSSIPNPAAVGVVNLRMNIKR
jgi:hypothetical protein